MSFSVEDQRTGASGHGNSFAILPGIGAHFALWDGLGVLAGVYRGFSPPVPSSGDVAPELSVNYEAGVRYAAGRTGAELIGFHNDYSNLTDVCTRSSGCLTQNLEAVPNSPSVKVYAIAMGGAESSRDANASAP